MSWSVFLFHFQLTKDHVVHCIKHIRKLSRALQPHEQPESFYSSTKREKTIITDLIHME
eukprot:UN17576